MKKFLIQGKHNRTLHDFSFHLLEAIDYHKWFYNETIYTSELSENVDEPNCIPIGSLEFVFSYLKKHYGIDQKSIHPINIPKELFTSSFLKRQCEVLKKEEIKVNKPLFIKSATEYKGFTSLVDDASAIPEGTFFVSEEIDILSEWRTFVFNGKLVGIHHYLGDFTLFPEVSMIQKMITSYKDCPPAYTLDVGINKDGTFLIEVHPFVSCGLYGFRDYKLLPSMFISSFHYLVKKINK